MKLKRGKMLIDPPASASSDIAFILIIFFLVCAAIQPETGLAQILPKTEEKKDVPAEKSLTEAETQANLRAEADAEADKLGFGVKRTGAVGASAVNSLEGMTTRRSWSTSVTRTSLSRKPASWASR